MALPANPSGATKAELWRRPSNTSTVIRMGRTRQRPVRRQPVCQTGMTKNKFRVTEKSWRLRGRTVETCHPQLNIKAVVSVSGDPKSLAGNAQTFVPRSESRDAG